MIGAAITASASIAGRLADKARRLAEAHLRRRMAGPARWRRAALLWPLFAKD